jgi:hypothetical protein
MILTPTAEITLAADYDRLYDDPVSLFHFGNPISDPQDFS